MQQVSGGAIAAAFGFLRLVMFGPLADILSTLAVASIGALMLAGRIDVHRTVQIILGCFVVLAASGIAAGIQGSLVSVGAPGAAPIQSSDESLAEAQANSGVSDHSYDPYAGAAVGVR